MGNDIDKLGEDDGQEDSLDEIEDNVVSSKVDKKQDKYEALIEQTKPFRFKVGVSGNPGGRPKGKSMKEFSRDYLAAMTEEERIEFMNNLPKELVYRMAEGNPREHIEILDDTNPYANYTDEQLNKEYLVRKNKEKGKDGSDIPDGKDSGISGDGPDSSGSGNISKTDIIDA